jgi:hypothetical protein
VGAFIVWILGSSLGKSFRLFPAPRAAIVHAQIRTAQGKLTILALFDFGHAVLGRGSGMSHRGSGVLCMRSEEIHIAIGPFLANHTTETTP